MPQILFSVKFIESKKINLVYDSYLQNEISFPSIDCPNIDNFSDKSQPDIE
jgi:hypothetical protein